MQYSQTNKPKKLNTDKHPKYLLPDESFFLLNNDTSHAEGVDTPLPANYQLCEIDLPAGDNYNAGRRSDQVLNEEYNLTYNTNGAHFIGRVKENGECEVVYFGECLKVYADPKNEVVKFRSQLHINRLCNKVPTGILKQLVWVDGISDEIFMIDVEASIATGNFNTPFFDLCRDDCAYITMCVPQPQSCIHAEFVPLVSADYGKTNYISDKGLKFMFRHEYYDGRRSEWSDRSTLYFQNSKGCFDSGEGLSRCLKFSVPLGNPMVEKIHIGVSEDGGVTYSLYDTINKYKDYTNTQQYWYQRNLREDLSIDYNSCTVEYLFCNDRQKTAISPTELSRVVNPTPRKVQGILPLPKGVLGFYNYEKGVCPLNENEVDKIKVEVNCENTKACSDEIVEVKVRALVYNFYLANNGNIASWFIYRNGGTSGATDDINDTARFGSPNAASTTPIYSQYFGGKARNFITYIEGLDLQSEMTQWKSTQKMASVSEVGVIAAGLDPFNIARYSAAFYYQEASLFVKKGTKGFIRLTSHLEDNALGENQDTSTQVKGIFNIKQYNGDNTLPFYKDGVKEVFFDTCNTTNGILDLSDAFVIEDLWTSGSGKKSSAYNGYIYDSEKLPVEGARIYANGSYQAITDHNGFYSFYIFDGNANPLAIDVYAEKDCGTFQKVGSFSSTSSQLQTAYTDYTITDITYNTFRQKVRVQVKDCNGNGVGGIRIAISGSKYRVTEADGGYAYFNLRNYYTRDRKITAVLMDKGGCITTDCSGGCNPCMPSSPILQLPSCFIGSTPIFSIDTPFVINTVISQGERGLKNGGTYPFGIVAEGDCGKLSAVYDIGYVNIPSVQERGGVGFCNLSFNIIDNTIKLPDWVTSLKIVRGENIYKVLLQWVVDSIERTSNGQLKITLQSLNDYNALYNFKSNTAYKYAAGDRVEFIKNGDGKLFPEIVNLQINSPYNDTIISGVKDAPADFFNQILVKDDNRLSGLKKGAIIEIKRQQPITDKPFYFGICASIPVVNGVPIAFAGNFETFDTYIVKRQIGKFPSQPFEHFAPSDFYDNIITDDRGKVFFKNEYENEKRYDRNITANNPNVFNYFGDFEKTFGIPEQGGIVALNIKDEKIGMGISEKGNFLFSVSDDLLRVSQDGVIRASSPDQVISNPEAKVRGEYGCKYEDIGSILFGDGYALWVDANAKGYIINNYREAKYCGLVRSEDAVISTCSNYFNLRITQKEKANIGIADIFKYRYSTGIDKIKKVVYLTLRRWADSGIFNQKEIAELRNETIIYDPETDNYKGFSSFTPEAYSDISLNVDRGSSFITYLNAIPYVHPVIAEKWNEFFGVACDWVIGVTLNKGADKIKIPVSIELQSDKMFYIYKAFNDKCLSEIPPARMVSRMNGKWNAAFLKNINTKGGLYEGDICSGYYLNVVLVRDNTVDLKVNTKNEAKMTEYSELDLILMKFSAVEQSGFTSNL